MCTKCHSKFGDQLPMILRRSRIPRRTNLGSQKEKGLISSLLPGQFVYTNQQCFAPKYSRLRCLLRVKGLVICFYLGWSGRILQIRTNIIKVGSKSWLLTCSSKIILSLPSCTISALQREGLQYFHYRVFIPRIDFYLYYNSVLIRFVKRGRLHCILPYATYQMNFRPPGKVIYPKYSKC